MNNNTSYYALYLKRCLQEENDERAEDRNFIDTRAELAASEYEASRLAGLTVDAAHERAMRVLTDVHYNQIVT